MALLNTGCLISTTQVDVTGVTTGYAAECFVILAAGLDAATSDRCVTLPVSGCLPSLYPTQTIPDGQVLFVEDIGVPVIAANGKWIGFDKRILRRDAPIMGELFTWGDNVNGELADGTKTPRSSPGTVSGGGTNWSIVSMGRYYGAGIKTDGTLWTWGCNAGGVLGNGTNVARSSPGTVAGGGTNWCGVSSGMDHVLAIKTDGTIWAWGSNLAGGLGDGTTTNRSSPVTVAGAGNTWCSISAGTYSSAAIKTDGTLWTWGWGGSGRLGNGTTTDRSSPGTTAGGGNTWCHVSVKYGFSLAIKTDGTLWTWGYNGGGQLGDGTTTNRSSPGTTAGGGTNWSKASAGGYHSMAIKNDGTLWTWGSTSFGQLGDGGYSNRSSPGTVAGGGTNWCNVSADRYYLSSAIKTDGTLWTWGANNNGALGNGTAVANSRSPVSVIGGITTWFCASMGSFGGAAIKM